MDWQGWLIPRGLTRRRGHLSAGPPAEDDLARLRELRDAGSRMDLPHPIRFFLDFETEAEGRAAQGQLEREGSRGQLRSEPGGAWRLTVVEQVVPSPGAVTKLREMLSAAAEAHGGRLAGWTAPVVY